MGTLRIVLAPTLAQHDGVQIAESEGIRSQSLTTSGTAATSSIVTADDLGGIKFTWFLSGSDDGQWVRFSRTSPVEAAAVGTGWYVPAGGSLALTAKPGQSLSAIDA